MRVRGATLDTGVLIAVERGKLAGIRLLALLSARRGPISVPAAVLTEWWRGGARQARVRKVFKVEPLKEAVAEAAGVALGSVRGATVVDAIVMASAAVSGDTVYTTDFDDLARLRELHFRSVHVMALGSD
jgi:predicted nucleic acid-binding protein